MRQTLTCVLLLSASLAGAAEKKAVVLPGANPNLPFSAAVWTGDFLYLSGSLGTVPGAGFADGIEAQARQTFANLGRTLEAAGLDASQVVSVSVYLTDDRHYEAMNRVFREVFPGSGPARATVRTDLAAAAGLIEVSMVAVRKGIETRTIRPDGWREAPQGFSYGVLAGDTLFAAGVVSSNPEKGEIVPGDITAQTKKALQNLGQVLEAAGMSYRDVVVNRVYLRDARDFSGMNDVYKSVFTEDPPARATVRAGIMHPDARFEIQSVAVKDASRRIVGERRPGSPLSPSVLASGRLFLAGMTGRRSEGGYALGDVRAQTRRAIERLEATLAAAGLTLADVVESRVYLTDVRHFQAMNEVYRELLPEPRPARTTVGTALMAPDALVEIMMVADAEK